MLSAIILAGGKSTRMGRDKALLEFNGKTIIRYLVDELGTVADQVVISANEPERFCDLGVAVVADIHKGLGSLAGLHTGLWFVDAERAFVCACDMPLLTSDIVRRMSGIDPAADVVVPKVDGFYEPLCAVYSKRCLSHIEADIARGERRIISFYRHVKVRDVGPQHFPEDPGMRFLTNINTPQDLENLNIGR